MTFSPAEKFKALVVARENAWAEYLANGRRDPNKLFDADDYLTGALQNLAAEMSALWSAAVEMDVEGGEILHSAGFWDALDALNTKAEEVLK